MEVKYRKALYQLKSILKMLNILIFKLKNNSNNHKKTTKYKFCSFFISISS